MMDQTSSRFWEILKDHPSSRAPMRLAGAFAGTLSQLDFSFCLVLISVPSASPTWIPKASLNKHPAY